MIQIRGKFYKKHDYEILKQLLILGTKAFDCAEQDNCEICPHKIICSDIDSVIDYCDEKIKQGVCKS